MMNKNLLIASSLILLLSSSVAINSRNVSPVKGEELASDEFKGQTLTIYNCEDYISQGEDDSRDLIGEFEEMYGVKVNYYTYDTNETMYNQFTLQKEGTYDLICTSEYMLQKMVKNNLLEPLVNKEQNIPNYYSYVSPTLQEKLENMSVTLDGKQTNLSDYAVGYMWGTLGIIYDPSVNDGKIQDDVMSWDILWNSDYKDLISIKNSMRDTFVVGLMHYYSQDENFKKVMDAYLSSPSDETYEAYNALVQDTFDFKLDGSATSDQENKEKIENVKNELITLKDNIFGFEVDSGKNDIITGKIKLNTAWSGDAVYSMQTALEEYGKVLEYKVPNDGGNIWYDGWVTPKGANKELAYKFLDFLSDPSSAADNMDYIGYTPFVVGDDIYNLAASNYGVGSYDPYTTYYYYPEEEYGDYVYYDNKLYMCIKDTEEGILPTNEEYFELEEYDEEYAYSEGDIVSLDGKFYNCLEDEQTNTLVVDSEGNSLSSSWEENVGYDLSHLFEGSFEDENREAIIYPFLGSENQLETQYPSEEIIARCAIMNDFGDYNDAVIIMWGQVKAYTDMTPIYIFLSIVALIGIGGISYSIIKRNLSAHYKRNAMKKEQAK